MKNQQNNDVQSTSNIKDNTKGFKNTSSISDITENGMNVKEGIRAIGPATEPPPP